MKASKPTGWFNSFSTELFKVDYSCSKSGVSISHLLKVLDYIDKYKANNADFRWDSSLRADSPESVLFAKNTILPLALKKLRKDHNNRGLFFEVGLL